MRKNEVACIVRQRCPITLHDLYIFIARNEHFIFIENCVLSNLQVVIATVFLFGCVYIFKWLLSFDET